MTFWKHVAAHAIGTLIAALVILVVGKAATQAVHVSWGDIGRIVGIALLALLVLPRLVMTLGETVGLTVHDYRAVWEKMKRFRKPPPQ